MTEFDFIGDIGFLVEEIIIVAALATLTYLVNHFRNKGKDIGKIKSDLNKLKTKQINLQRTIVVMTKLIDDQTKHAHPDVHMELEDIIKEMLTDAVLEKC